MDGNIQEVLPVIPNNLPLTAGHLEEEDNQSGTEEIARLKKAISLLEQAKDLLKNTGSEANLTKRICSLNDELVVLLSHQEPAPIAGHEEEEEPFDVADPDAPTWSLRTYPENDLDFDDTDEEFDSEPTLGVTAVAAKAKTPKQTLTFSTDPIQYAPVQPPLSGTMSMCGVYIKWKGTEPKGSVSNMCGQIAKNYREITANQFKLNVVAKVVSVSYEKSHSNLRKAEEYAKRVVNGGEKPKYNRYAMIGGILPNHAAGNTMHLTSTLITTGKHELGHTLPKPNNLQHASVYVNEKGKWVLQSSRDGFSFMSIYSAYGVSGPQQYKAIGMPENKVAQYTIGTSKVYNMELLYRPQYSEGYLRGVYIPNPTQGSDMFLSLVKNKQGIFFALHYFQKDNGGSQRVGVFKEQFQFNGLHDELNPGLFIHRDEFSDERATVSIKPALLNA